MYLSHQLSHLLTLGAQIGVAIQQIEMFAGAQQRKVLTLPVDVHQISGHLAQQRKRDRASVDAADVALVEPHLPPQQQKVGRVALQPLAFQHGIDLGPLFRRQPEDRLDESTLGAGPHDGRVGSLAQHQLDRVDDDRFPRAGLAGQHQKSRRQAQLQPVDDSEITNAQFGQH